MNKEQDAVMQMLDGKEFASSQSGHTSQSISFASRDEVAAIANRIIEENIEAFRRLAESPDM